MQTNGSRAPWAFVILMILVEVAHGLSTACHGQNLPAKIVADLETNAASLNPLTVSWERKRSSGLDLGALLKTIKSSEEREFLKNQSDTVIYQGNKLWSNTRRMQWSRGKYVNSNTDTAFDGDLLYVSDSTKPMPSVLILDPSYLAKNPDDFLYYCEYLEAAGFRVHNRQGTFRRPPESDLLALINHGGKTSGVRPSKVDSDPCVEVEVTLPEQRHVFWLDPARRHIVRKHEVYKSQGSLVREILNSEFAELAAPRVWLPKRCSIKDFTWDTIPEEVFKEPIVKTSLEVTELSRKTWPADRFAIDSTRPGSFVLDSRNGAVQQHGAVLSPDGFYHYRIDPGPDDLATAVGVSNSGRRSLLIWLNVIVVALVVVGFAVFRRNRGGRENPATKEARD